MLSWFYHYPTLNIRTFKVVLYHILCPLLSLTCLFQKMKGEGQNKKKCLLGMCLSFLFIHLLHFDIHYCTSFPVLCKKYSNSIIFLYGSWNLAKIFQLHLALLKSFNVRIGNILMHFMKYINWSLYKI